MSGQTIESLLEKVFSRPGDYDLLEEVKRRAEEVILFLEKADPFENSLRLGSGNTEWLSEFYASLGEDDELSPSDSATLEALFKANKEDEIGIGYAFKEALIPDLPRSLAEFTSFSDLKPIDQSILKDILNEPAVRAASPASDQIARFGLTPLSIFYASEAVSGLIDRLRRHEQLTEMAIVLEPQKKYSSTILYDLLVDETANMTECDRVTAQAILEWLVEVAQYKPYLFDGLIARPKGQHGIRLEPSGESQPDLFKRWSRATEVRHSH